MAGRIPRAEVLRELASIRARTDSLKLDLTEELTPSDIAMGAEALSSEQICEELDQIGKAVETIATQHLRAEFEEWWNLVGKTL